MCLKSRLGCGGRQDTDGEGSAVTARLIQPGCHEQTRLMNLPSIAAAAGTAQDRDQVGNSQTSGPVAPGSANWEGQLELGQQGVGMPRKLMADRALPQDQH